MKKSEEVKERIIQETIALIQKSNGTVAEITTREIAEKAGVGNGLINYHFQTKENLISLCVARIIRQVVEGFQPKIDPEESPQERMTRAASLVFEFLFSNPAISRISILGDLVQPSPESNTVKSQQNICQVLGVCWEEEEQKLFSFLLATAMQVAFLSNQWSDTMLGCKLDTPESRKAFISRLVALLVCGKEVTESRIGGNANGIQGQ